MEIDWKLRFLKQFKLNLTFIYLLYVTIAYKSRLLVYIYVFPSRVFQISQQKYEEVYEGVENLPTKCDVIYEQPLIYFFFFLKQPLNYRSQSETNHMFTVTSMADTHVIATSFVE